MARFDAVILAAGLSSRMGARNKLLLKIRGTPMLVRVVRNYLDAIDGSVTLVTGQEAEALEKAVAHLPIKIQRNLAFEKGQQSSVVAGLSVPSGGAATLLGLGDQPMLSADDLRWLMDAHAAAPSKITIPQHEGQRGNPIVIPASMRPRMLADPKSAGCRAFTRENPDLVRFAASPSVGFVVDIDTPEEYSTYLAMKGDTYGIAL